MASMRRQRRVVVMSWPPWTWLRIGDRRCEITARSLILSYMYRLVLDGSAQSGPCAYDWATFALLTTVLVNLSPNNSSSNFNSVLDYVNYSLLVSVI
jgi:hypothetical protein